jgi:hypothetical protein
VMPTPRVRRRGLIQSVLLGPPQRRNRAMGSLVFLRFGSFRLATARRQLSRQL